MKNRKIEIRKSLLHAQEQLLLNEIEDQRLGVETSLYKQLTRATLIGVGFGIGFGIYKLVFAKEKKTPKNNSKSTPTLSKITPFLITMGLKSLLPLVMDKIKDKLQKNKNHEENH